MSDITDILAQIEPSDPRGAEKLLPLVYDELRKLAAAKLSQEKPGQTLQATALVHEAYLRLVGSNGGTAWDGRRHFFGAAAEAMRRILVEQARSKGRQKRGGGYRRIEFDEIDQTIAAPNDNLLDLDAALSRLAERHPEKAELVKLRYFAGLSVDEAAMALGISPATADRYWTYSRAWLLRALSPDAES